MTLKQGLHEKAVQIYEKLVKTAHATATDIAQLTGIKRSDVYVHLHTLISVGLAERVLINKKVLYRACDPEVLSSLVEREQKKVASLSSLYQMSTMIGNNPRVRVFEGKQQIERLYHDIHGANSVVSWFGVGDAAQLLSPIAYPLADHIQEHKMTFKDIIPNEPRAIAYAKKMKRLKGRTYVYRVANTQDIENDILVYGNKVAIIKLDEHDFYATVIEDPSFANTFRTIFNLSWKALGKKSDEVDEP
jgi:predicted transcriptional regulator